MPRSVSAVSRWVRSPRRGGDGTSTNFALYCVCVVLRRDRGQTVDAGWLRPFLLLWAAYLVVVSVVFWAGRVARRPHRNADPED